MRPHCLLSSYEGLCHRPPKTVDPRRSVDHGNEEYTPPCLGTARHAAPCKAPVTEVRGHRLEHCCQGAAPRLTRAPVRRRDQYEPCSPEVGHRVSEYRIPKMMPVVETDQLDHPVMESCHRRLHYPPGATWGL